MCSLTVSVYLPLHSADQCGRQQKNHVELNRPVRSSEELGAIGVGNDPSMPVEIQRVGGQSNLNIWPTDRSRRTLLAEGAEDACRRFGACSRPRQTS